MDQPPHAPIPTFTQAITLWIAGAFLTLACFGFLPRLTQNLESLNLSGLGSEALLFGLFHVSVLHNVVHLLLGAAALASTGTARRCRIYLGSVGVGLIVLVGYGQLDTTPVLSDVVPVNAADAWLHTLFAVTMIVSAIHGIATNERARRPCPR